MHRALDERYPAGGPVTLREREVVFLGWSQTPERNTTDSRQPATAARAVSLRPECGSRRFPRDPAHPVSWPPPVSPLTAWEDYRTHCGSNTQIYVSCFQWEPSRVFRGCQCGLNSEASKHRESLFHTPPNKIISQNYLSLSLPSFSPQTNYFHFRVPEFALNDWDIWVRKAFPLFMNVFTCVI